MSDYLPVEIILEILKRLPVKSLVKFRLVCKTWNSLICSSSFILTHLQTVLPKLDTQLLLLRRLKNGKESYFLHFDNDDFDEFKQLHFPVESCLPYSAVVGSCNGLVCLQLFYYNILDIIFWNPSIQKFITLPKLNCLNQNYFIFGFGFVSRTNDYKLLIATENGEEAYLFSLNENSWKKVTASFPNYAIEGESGSTFVNGIIHCMGYHRKKNYEFRNAILGFDLITEEFLVIKLPDSLISLCPMDLSIMKYEESFIAVLKRDWGDRDLLDIWIMKEYGVVGSWTKAFHFTDQNGSLPRVLGFRKNGEILLEMEGGEMASLDLNCQQMEHLGIETKVGLSFVESYVESLVLLDKGVDASSVNDAVHADDSSDSDASSEGESEMT